MQLRNFMLPFSIAVMIGATSNSDARPKKEKWTKLLDGKTTKGWHSFNKQGTAGGAWQVANGALYFNPAFAKANPGSGGDIVTDEAYENFHLKLEWKISPKGNSGIIFYVQEGPGYSNTYVTGPEMQVLDNDGHPDGKINKHRAGDLYDLIACSTETVKPVGQWNAVEIISNKGTLEFILNGTKVVSTTMRNEAWKTMLAGSKFKSMPNFGKFTNGRIALQDHGDEVWYRNIMIRKL
jgi:hypothetical protein